MSKLRYTEEHEWLRADDAGLFTVGITSHAQHALGDIVYVQLPELRHYAAGEEIAVLESVKAASNIIAAVPGEVVAVNDSLESDPGLVNTSPMDEGWFFRFQPDDAADIQGLLTGDAYDRLLTALADH